MDVISTRVVYIGIGVVRPNLLSHAVRGNALKLLSKVWIVVDGAQVKQLHVTVQSSQEFRMLGAVQAKWTAEWLILSKHDIDVYKTFKRFCGWLKELDFRREYSLGDITGLYGILKWCGMVK